MEILEKQKTIVITQPTYIPWLGYFEQIARADVFVFLDIVQYVHQEWNNRNRLKGTNGEPVWLTIPVEKHPLETNIEDIKISSNKHSWATKHLNTISSLLGKTPYIQEFLPQLARLYGKENTNLCEFNIELIKLISQWLGLKVKFVRASELGPSGKRTEMLLDICLQLEAAHYYSPAGAAVYLENERHILENAGISISYQRWEHPIYAQKFGGFLSHMSVLDAIMNAGPERTREFIRQRND